MSLSLEFATSPPEAYEEFKCLVCLQLPNPSEAAVTKCSHVFCGPCIAGWRARSSRCPTCNADVPGAEGVARLKTANPLAFRLLGRIQVKCPISASCKWTGDYSELDPHMTSSDAHADKSTAIQGMKTAGNERFQRGDYEGAAAAYTKALAMVAALSPEVESVSSPTAPAPPPSESESAAPDSDSASPRGAALRELAAQLHANRAAALLGLGRPAPAAEDCARAARLGSTDAKLFVRWARALTEAGDFHGATRALESGANVPGLKDVLANQLRRAQSMEASFASARDAVDRNDFVAARAHLAPLVQDQGAGRCARVLALTAVVESAFGSTELANRLSLEALRQSQDAEWAWTARSRVLLTAGDFDGARRAARQALTLNPDDQASKDAVRAVKTLETIVQSARDAAEAHDFARSRDLYAQVLEPPGAWLSESSPLRVMLLAERADASFRAGLYEDALRDAGKAIYLKDDTVKAWATRFYCLRHLGRHEEAVRDGRDLLERWGQSDNLIRSLVERAEFDLRKSKRPDLYQVLEVSPLASEPEIKAAYKRQALVHHPDKVSPDASADVRAAAEARFKMLGIALDVLGNAEKRALWDQGFDAQGIADELARRQAHANFATGGHRR